MNTASIFKKMATIVAIVGAGLLAALLEQAEAQMSPFYYCADVTEVTVTVQAGHTSVPGVGFGKGDFKFTVEIDRDNGSGWLSEPKTGHWGAAPSVLFPISFRNNRSASPVWWTSRQNIGDSPVWYSLKPGSSNYYYIKMWARNGGADDWIDLAVWVSKGLDGTVEASAWAIDGDGDSYSVDVNIEYVNY